MKIASITTPLPSRPPAPGRPTAEAPVEPVDGYAGVAQAQVNTPPTLDKLALRQALGNFPTGVTVVTTGKGDERHGMTASSFNSVSLDPPLVLFSAGSDSATLAALRHNGSFAIQVLGAGQSDLCYKFSKGTPAERFAGVEVSESKVTGSPLLAGTLGHFDCQVHQIVPAGDHSIVIGRVVDMQAAQQGEPLTFWGGKLQNTEGWTRR